MPRTRFQHEANRLSGRRAVELRHRRIDRHPLCEECLKRGITKCTEEIDHIVPLAFGGTDTDDNIQGLCLDCHQIKSASENASHEGAATHPDWLKPSAIPLTTVCGPPCSGKTTYVQANATASDIIIDLDSIYRRIKPDYQHWQDMLEASLISEGIRIRNAMLGSLAHQKIGTAWFIVSAPHAKEREWWKRKLGGSVLLLHPGTDECKARAISRGTPNAINGVDDWERKAKMPWLEPNRTKRLQPAW